MLTVSVKVFLPSPALCPVNTTRCIRPGGQSSKQNSGSCKLRGKKFFLVLKYLLRAKKNTVSSLNCKGRADLNDKT